MTSITGNGIDQSFEYNGNGIRLSKTVDGETTYFVNDLNQSYEQVLQTYDSDGNVINTYTYGVQRIQSVGETNETYLYDGRGSVVGTINQDDILTSYAYTAYGELMPESPTPNVFGYNGEATDYTTGLQYLRARYYDVGTQRFVQEDDYRGDFSEPQTINRYIYVINNPINYIDPSGYYYTPSKLLIDGGNSDYWASEEYRNREIKSPEEYYQEKANQSMGSDDGYCNFYEDHFGNVEDEDDDEDLFGDGSLEQWLDMNEWEGLEETGDSRETLTEEEIQALITLVEMWYESGTIYYGVEEEWAELTDGRVPYPEIGDIVSVTEDTTNISWWEVNASNYIGGGLYTVYCGITGFGLQGIAGAAYGIASNTLITTITNEIFPQYKSQGTAKSLSITTKMEEESTMIIYEVTKYSDGGILMTTTINANSAFPTITEKYYPYNAFENEEK